MAAKSRLCGLWIPSAWPLDPVCVAAESCLRASRTGAFTSLYQDAPHDLLSGIGDFYERRRLTLDEILGRIRLGMGREILARSWLLPTLPTMGRVASGWTGRVSSWLCCRQ